MQGVNNIVNMEITWRGNWAWGGWSATCHP